MSGNDSDLKDQEKIESCDIDDETPTLTPEVTSKDGETKPEQLSVESKNGKKIGELKKAHLDEITDLRVNIVKKLFVSFLIYFFALESAR